MAPSKSAGISAQEIPYRLRLCFLLCSIETPLEWTLFHSA